MKTSIDVCDLCGCEFKEGDAYYGAADPGPRHYDCHVAEFGEPDPFGLKKLDRLKNDIDALRGKLDDLKGQTVSGRFSASEPNYSNAPKRRGPGPVER